MMNDATTTVDGFELALAGFVAKAQAMIDAHYAKHLANLPGEQLTIERGRRYVRIVKSSKDASWGGEHGSRSVYCFVDATNGDVLKAESWKKPAKHARGTIYGESAITPYGAAYMR